MTSMDVSGDSIKVEWSGVEGATYSLLKSTNLVDGFTMLESEIPVHEGTNVNSMATPNDHAFY